MESGIYMITNLRNNKRYVGSSKNLSSRKWQHFNNLKNNTHANKYLQSSYNKHGVEFFNFSILQKCSLEDLITRENYWIEIFSSLDSKYGYNLSIPLERGGCTFTEKITDALRRTAFEKHHGPLTDEEFQIRKYIKDAERNREKIDQRKKVFGFDENTGELLKTFNSISEIGKDGRIYKILDNTKKTFKGMILIREENFNPSVLYKKVYKERPVYEPKGRFLGKPIETFDLETLLTLEQFNNKHELMNVLQVSEGGLSKFLTGERKSLKGVGVRYTV